MWPTIYQAHGILYIMENLISLIEEIMVFYIHLLKNKTIKQSLGNIKHMKLKKLPVEGMILFLSWKENVRSEDASSFMLGRHVVHQFGLLGVTIDQAQWMPIITIQECVPHTLQGVVFPYL